MARSATTDYFGPAGVWDSGIESDLSDYFGPSGWMGGKSHISVLYTRDIAQGIGIAAVPTRALTLNRGIGQGLVISPAAARQLTANRAATLDLGVEAAQGRTITASREVGQGISVSGVASRVATLSRTIAQSIGVNAVAARVVTLSRGIAEGIGIAASAARQFVGSRTAAVTLGLGLVASASYGYTRDIAQTITISAVAVRQIACNRAASVSLTISDAVTRIRALTRSIAETINIAAATTRQITVSRSIAQGINASATAARRIAVNRAANVAVTISDAVTSARGFVRNIAQHIGIYANAEDVVTMEMFAATSLTRIQSIGAAIRRGLNSLIPDWPFKGRGGGKRIVPVPVLKLKAGATCFNTEGDPCTDGERVSLWKDLTNNEFDAVVAGVPEDNCAPLYKSAIPAANGKPVVRFDGQYKRLVVAGGPALNPIDTLTVVLVMSATLFGGDGDAAYDGSVFGRNRPYEEGFPYALAFQVRDEVVSAKVDALTDPPIHLYHSLIVPVTVELDKFYIWTITYRRPASGVINICLYLNGDKIGDQTFNGTRGSLLYGEGTGIGHAGNYDGSLLYDLAELRVYSTIADEDYVRQIERELGTAYGITIP